MFACLHVFFLHWFRTYNSPVNLSNRTSVFKSLGGKGWGEKKSQKLRKKYIKKIRVHKEVTGKQSRAH